MTTAVARPVPTAALPAPAAPAAAPGDRPRYSVSFAQDEADVRAAQRLRHQVFVEEMGAVVHTAAPGLETDPFDAFCDHLLVRDDVTGDVVGTYRLLPAARAAVAGRLFSDGEFDLSAHAPIRKDLVEVGRSCVHPDHRDGAVVALMWGGICRYMEQTGHTWVAGCCSVPLADGGTQAAGVWDKVSATHLSPPEYRVRPLRPWNPEGVARPARTTLPALLRGYLRLGAWVCGEPAHDPDFNVADLYVLLSLKRTDPRYLRHFLSLTSPATAAPLT
jgi:putative hemolysin